MSYLLDLEANNFFDEKLSLAVLLVQGLKVVKGCLTTSSLAQAISQIK